MKHKTGMLCIIVYGIFLFAALSTVLITDVSDQVTGEYLSSSNKLVDSDDEPREIALDSSGNSRVVENSGSSKAQFEYGPIKYSPAPLNGPEDIADAGPNQTVNEGDVVQFDGSGSFDPSGTIENYSWDFDTDVDSDGDGNKTNDVDATGSTPTHVYGDDGVYNVTLLVSSKRQDGGTVKVDQDVVLVIDSSGSMSWNDPDDIRIDAAKHYVYMLTPEDMVAVVDFDSQTTLLQSLTMDYYAAMMALDLIDSSGGTTLSPALEESITELEDNGDSDHKWAIILLTDAENLKQWDRDECYVQANRAVVDEIVIYTIGLNIDSPQEKKLLEDIANLTGGTYYAPPDPSDLYEIYDEISEEMENTSSGWVNDTDTMQVTVENVDPAIGSFSASGGDEGAVITYTSTATDPGSDDLTFTWNWGDGTSDTVTIYYNDGAAPEPIYDPIVNKIKSPGGTYLFSATDTVDHIYGDDGVYTITLSVGDDDGGDIIDTRTVTITNVVPTINSVSAPDGDEGAVITYSSSATDPGSDDLTFTWNWGDGTSDTINIYYNDGVGPDPDPSPLGTYPFSATDTVDHIYGDDGVYTITLTVEDDDSGVKTDTKTVTINNVAPNIDSVSAPDGDEGALVSFSSTATDPGSDDLTFTWNWGDGTSDTVTIYY
ncbi:MAG: PKD domain-containing protein, partial [Thermoplasmata archaeon]